MDHGIKEMMLFNLSDVIHLMSSFHDLYDLKTFQSLKLGDLHQGCFGYLQIYMSKAKKDIKGSEFASLCDMIV